MFDRYYCIKTNCDGWKVDIFEQNEPVNLYSLPLKARRNGTFTACVLKTPLPGQIPKRHVDVMFLRLLPCTLLTLNGMHTVKAAKQVYNSTWIALLKHGFVLVKTWLLIACDTGFYAIIKTEKYSRSKVCPTSTFQCYTVMNKGQLSYVNEIVGGILMTKISGLGTDFGIEWRFVRPQIQEIEQKYAIFTISEDFQHSACIHSASIQHIWIPKIYLYMM